MFCLIHYYRYNPVSKIEIYLIVKDVNFTFCQFSITGFKNTLPCKKNTYKGNRNPPIDPVQPYLQMC